MTGDTKNDDIDERSQREAVRAMLSALPPSFEARYSAMRKLRNMVQEEMAAAIRPSLNAWAVQMPRDTTDQRVRLAAQIGHAMHMLGLVLTGPRTGEPADLAVVVERSDSGPGRFRFQERAGRRRACLKATAELPDLLPMGDPLEAQSLEPWLRLSRSQGQQR